MEVVLFHKLLQRAWEFRIWLRESGIGVLLCVRVIKLCFKLYTFLVLKAVLYNPFLVFLGCLPKCVKYFICLSLFLSFFFTCYWLYSFEWLPVCFRIQLCMICELRRLLLSSCCSCLIWLLVFCPHLRLEDWVGMYDTLKSCWGRNEINLMGTAACMALLCDYYRSKKIHVQVGTWHLFHWRFVIMLNGCCVSHCCWNGCQINCAQNSDIGQEIVGFVFGLHYGLRFSGCCRKVAVERV